MKSKLPPIDTTEEVEKYKARAETRDLSIDRCTHRDARYRDGEIRCSCGAAWTGERLHELLKNLTI